MAVFFRSSSVQLYAAIYVALLILVGGVGTWRARYQKHLSALGPSAAAASPLQTEMLTAIMVQTGNEFPIFLITPTYSHSHQMAHLSRLFWTIITQPALIWMVIQDASTTDGAIEDLFQDLFDSVRRHRYLSLVSDLEVWYLPAGTEKRQSGCRGLKPRNRGLIEIFDSSYVDGWLYFMDEDNTLNPTIFEEIRKVKRVGLFPVGTMGKSMVSTPLVSANGTIAGFHDPYMSRLYPVDMAGMAMRLRAMRDIALQNQANVKDYWLWSRCKAGQMESQFLEKVTRDKSQLECVANNCSEILVWHTRSEPIETWSANSKRRFHDAAHKYINVPPLYSTLDSVPIGNRRSHDRVANVRFTFPNGHKTIVKFSLRNDTNSSIHHST